MAKLFVLGLIENQGKFLLLKRNYPPKIWSGPSGWLTAGESPEECLLREIKEETALEVKILCPLSVWSKNQGKIIGLCFLCRLSMGQIKINHEHIDFMWKTVEEIEAAEIKCSPSLEEIQIAKKILQACK